MPAPTTPHGDAVGTVFGAEPSPAGLSPALMPASLAHNRPAPYYLREVFTRLPSMTNWQVKDITPEAWATKNRPPVDRRVAA